MNNYIDNSNNKLLETYKNSIKSYEDAINLYENNNIVSGSITTREFNLITAINYSWSLTKWKIIDVQTSKVVYTSGTYSYGKEFHFNFVDTLGAKDGSLYLLKAAVKAGSDSTADMIIKVNSVISSTGVFWLEGTTLNNRLTFIGTY